MMGNIIPGLYETGLIDKNLTLLGGGGSKQRYCRLGLMC
jgi:hypothetical protein